MKININLRKIFNEKLNKEFEFAEFPVRISGEIDNEVILEDLKKMFLVQMLEFKVMIKIVS